MAITKIQSESLNLVDTYAFTGTVTGAGFPNDALFAYTVSSSQSIATATWTKVQLDEAIPSNSTLDTSTNYRYTVPSGKAEKFHIGLSGNWEHSEILIIAL